MKKTVLFLLMIFGMFLLISCVEQLPLPTDVEETEEVIPIKDIDHTLRRIPAPENYLLDDFSNGLDSEKWYISTRNWSPAVSQGQKADNVQVTEDGFLVLNAHGMYHPDENKRLTGSAIISTESFGAGKYEISMKVLPRLGVVSAFWTFYYEGEDYNHEIDIEFPGNKSLRNVLNTNWVGVNRNSYKTVVAKTESPANDGEWHKYTFEWHTDPKIVKYYVDDVLTSEITDHVPFAQGQLWVGAWFANNWAGVPDFETDFLLVDWISFEPYDQPTLETTPNAFGVAPIHMYPEITNTPLTRNYISNGSYEDGETAWSLQGDAYIVSRTDMPSKKMLAVDHGGFASQSITAVYDEFQFSVEFKSSILRGTKGKLVIIMKDIDNEVITDGTVTYEFENLKELRHVFEFSTPIGTEKIEVRFESAEDSLIFIDDVNLKLKIE